MTSSFSQDGSSITGITLSTTSQTERMSLASKAVEVLSCVPATTDDGTVPHLATTIPNESPLIANPGWS